MPVRDYFDSHVWVPITIPYQERPMAKQKNDHPGMFVPDGHGHPDPGEKPAVNPMNPPPAEDDEPADSGGRRPKDKELSAMRRMLDILDELPAPAARRVVAYVVDRFQSPPPQE